MGEWYTKLDGLTFLHARLLEQVRHVRQVSSANGGRMGPSTMGDYVRQGLQSLLEYADDLYTHPPALPDAKMNRGETVQEYLKDLSSRLQQSDEVEEASARDTP